MLSIFNLSVFKVGMPILSKVPSISAVSSIVLFSKSVTYLITKCSNKVIKTIVIKAGGITFCTLTKKSN